MYSSVLVANRGEIARRVIRTLARLGIESVAVYSTADRDLPFVNEADRAFELGEAPPGASYLNVPRLLDAARSTGADAIHPGYGFLSENAAFAEAVISAGLGWIGPSPEAMRLMANKASARTLMQRAGLPVGAGSPMALTSLDRAAAEAARLGYPLMVKAVEGGGGIGMSIVRDHEQLAAAYDRVTTVGKRFFGNAGVLLERYLQAARHIELQILCSADGEVVTLGGRDCSVQRRYQKIVEESPPAWLPAKLMAAMTDGAERAAHAIDYRGVGTIEYLVDVAAGHYVFLEMNTRLQVEHPVTELVTGIDLVEQQILVAAGAPLSFDTADVKPRGHAIEFRLYAEDSVRFLPSTGSITQWREPVGPGIRVDAGYRLGNEVTPYYDPLLAKICAFGDDRQHALERAEGALSQFVVAGVRTNLDFLRGLVWHPEFVAGRYDTGLVDRMQAQAVNA